MKGTGFNQTPAKSCNTEKYVLREGMLLLIPREAITNIKYIKIFNKNKYRKAKTYTCKQQSVGSKHHS